MSTTPATRVSFTPVALTHDNSNRGVRGGEKKPQREARAKAMFSTAKGIEYLGVIPVQFREAIAKGNEVDLMGNIVSKAKPGILACVTCGLVHTLTDVRGTDNGHKNRHGSQLITLFRNVATKAVFSLSDTCRQDYFGLYAAKALINPETYFAQFPKATVKA